MKTLKGLFLIGALLAAGVLHARSPVPLVDVLDAPVVTRSNAPVSADAVRNAIIDGGAAGARKWLSSEGPNGTLRLTYKVRSHTMSVTVTNTATSYSLRYTDSINMKYSVEDGVPVIHPFYNKWVQELKTAIEFELRKL
jgi:hypothetical protein